MKPFYAISLALLFGTSPVEALFKKSSSNLRTAKPIRQDPPSQISEPKPGYAHLLFYGDFLYWKASVTNLPYAVTATAKTDPSLGFVVADNENVKEVQFDYVPGFRAGAGISFAKGWDMAGEWTRLHTFSHARKTANAPGLIENIWGLTLPATISSIRARQSFKFDQANFYFIKHFALGSCFALHPSFGAIGAVINQKLHLVTNQLFDDGIIGTDTSHIKNDFTGAGLSIGLNVELIPVKWFSFYGEGAYSLLYGKFKLSMASTNFIDIPATLSYRQSTSRFAVVSAFDVLAGLRLQWHFARCTLAAYGEAELFFWPGQVRVPRINSADLNFSKERKADVFGSYGDVGLQGLTAGMSLNF